MLPEIDREKLMEEYKFCHEKTNNLEGYIWKTATIFSIGSIAGIIALSIKNTSQSLNPLFSIVVGLLAIGTLIMWYRFARRWWSIQSVMFCRMKEIEVLVDLNINLYVDCQDDNSIKNEWKIIKNIKELDGKFLKTIGFNVEETTIVQPNKCKEMKNYTHYGVQPLVKFFILISIMAWIVVILFQNIPNGILHICKYAWTIHSWIIVIYLLFFIYFLIHYIWKN